MKTLLPWIAVLLACYVALAETKAQAGGPEIPFDAYKRRLYGVRDGLPSGWVEDLLQTRDGYLWIATRGGLARFDGIRFKTFPRSEFPVIPSDFLHTLYETRDGTLYVSGEGGLVRYQAGRPGSFEAVEALSGLDVTVVYEDASGTLWVGTRGQTWCSPDASEFHAVEEAPARVRAFCQDQNGTLWLGTETGLYMRNEHGFIRAAEEELGGPPNANTVFPTMFVHAIFEDDDGDLWISTRQGLLHYHDNRFQYRSEIGEAVVFDCIRAQRGGLHAIANSDLFRWPVAKADSTQRHVEHTEVGGDDHIGLVAKCFTEDREGGFWLGRDESAGIYYFDDGTADPQPEDDPPPPVYIDQVLIDGQVVDANGPLEILSGKRRVGIEFAAPTFRTPERVHVKYRMLQHDDDWVDAGQQRIAYYTDLRPGNYEFRVTADNGYGVWNEQETSLALRVRPRWWETYAFKFVTIAGVIALGLLHLRSRAHRIRRRNRLLHREIADRKKAENESLQHREQLARLSRASSMGEISTSIAHEIKQPLFAIASNAQSAIRLLQQEPPDIPEVREALTDIADDGNRASDIIAQVRSLVRKEPQPKEGLDLNQVVRQAIHLVGRDDAQSGLSISTDLATDLPPVMGSPVELQQVVINLIVNGLQSMSEIERGTRELKVTTSADEGSVQFTVVDHGVGFDEEQSQHLFDPFYTSKSHGTGMGLAISRTIVEAHGGRIWATSNDDGGATFQFRLPAATKEVV